MTKSERKACKGSVRKRRFQDSRHQQTKWKDMGRQRDQQGQRKKESGWRRWDGASSRDSKALRLQGGKQGGPKAPSWRAGTQGGPCGGPSLLWPRQVGPALPGDSKEMPCAQQSRWFTEAAAALHWDPMRRRLSHSAGDARTPETLHLCSDLISDTNQGPIGSRSQRGSQVPRLCKRLLFTTQTMPLGSPPICCINPSPGATS